jgi:hypothetical protein
MGVVARAALAERVAEGTIGILIAPKASRAVGTDARERVVRANGRGASSRAAGERTQVRRCALRERAGGGMVSGRITAVRPLLVARGRAPIEGAGAGSSARG